MPSHRVLILGGGFGGIAAAVALRGQLDPADEVIHVERRTTIVLGLRMNWAVPDPNALGEGERSLAPLAERGIRVITKRRGVRLPYDPIPRAASSWRSLSKRLRPRIPLDRGAPARARAAGHAPPRASVSPAESKAGTGRDASPSGRLDRVRPSRRSVKRPVSPRDVLLVGSLAIALAACAGENVPSPIQRPTGAADLVVRVETLGAMLPPLEAERRLPEISIYGDGSVLVPAQVPEVPGPAGYDLESFDIDGERLDQIVAAAQSVGLRGPERRLEQEGPQFVADAGYTVVTVVADAERHVTRAAALFDAPDGSLERQSLARFVEDLRALRGADPAPYLPTMLAVYVAAPDPGFQPDPASAQEAEWPFADPLFTWGQPVPPIMVPARCAVVSGDVLEAALPTLRAATSATVFVDAVGDRGIVAIRPLLPDEDACEDASPPIGGERHRTTRRAWARAAFA